MTWDAHVRESQLKFRTHQMLCNATGFLPLARSAQDSTHVGGSRCRWVKRKLNWGAVEKLPQGLVDYPPLHRRSDFPPFDLGETAEKVCSSVETNGELARCPRRSPTGSTGF